MGGGGGGGGSGGRSLSHGEQAEYARQWIIDGPEIPNRTSDGPCVREKLERSDVGLRQSARGILEITESTDAEIELGWDFAKTVRQCGRLGCGVQCNGEVGQHATLYRGVTFVPDDNPEVRCDDSFIKDMVKRGLSHKDAKS